jgi:hypothetical protein
MLGPAHQGLRWSVTVAPGGLVPEQAEVDGVAHQRVPAIAA